MGTRSENAEINKQKIVQAALELFQDEGYFQTNMRTIAAKANIGLGTFYNYFKTKKELYMFIFEQEYLSLGFSTFHSKELPTLQELPLKKLIVLLVKKHYEGHTHSLLFYREASALIALDPDIRSLNDKLEKKVHSELLGLLKAKQHEIRPIDFPLALTIITNALEENTHALLSCNSKEKVSATLKEITELIYSYLRN